MKIIKKIGDLETHHKIIAFIIFIILTMAITRILVLISDYDPIIKGYELHHFYYGVLLLIITCILMLFNKKHYLICLILSSISIGLIIDEFIYILGNAGNQQKYFSTLPSTIIFTGIIIIIVIITNSLSKKP